MKFYSRSLLNDWEANMENALSLRRIFGEMHTRKNIIGLATLYR